MSLTFTAVSSEHAAAILAGAPIVADGDECEGIVARWCDNCGQCTCPTHPGGDAMYEGTGVFYGQRLPGGTVIESHEGQRMVVAPDCPLHSEGTPHPTRRPPRAFVSATKPCPECSGNGKVFRPNPHAPTYVDPTGLDDCSACGGDGQQRIDIAVRCGYLYHEGCPGCDDSGLSVVGSVRAVEVLPIVRDISDAPVGRFVHAFETCGQWAIWLCERRSDGTFDNHASLTDRLSLYGSPSTLMGRFLVTVADAGPA